MEAKAVEFVKQGAEIYKKSANTPVQFSLHCDYGARFRICNPVVETRTSRQPAHPRM